MKTRKPVMILMADDDPEDRLLAREAVSECKIEAELHFVEDGEELLEYLRRTGRYAASEKSAPRPHLILLDLKMPRKTGFEVLAEIKADPALRQIPIVVLTTSAADEDVARSYDLGVNSFITKPGSFQALVDVMQDLGDYWFRTVELPTGED